MSAMYLIVSGGERPQKDLLREHASKAAMVIAADKGALYCVESDVVPHLVVGDMDSVPEEVLVELSRHNVEMLCFAPEKDQTDTQIALGEAIGRGAQEIEIMAGTGDRLDHVLANVHLLYMALLAGLKAYMITNNQQIFLLEKNHVFRGMSGRTVSFLPFTQRVDGIRMKGFAYELHDAVMEIGNPYGVSNRIISEAASIYISNGVMLVIVSWRV
ncbi:MAG: thiamine diphosphokinase [Deltaproteobacteria bacterium]|nr:thiamine diphosphokinase [Deltaproteobacteria bacterium]